MPITGYFQGHGEDVMRNMKKQYGAKKGTSVFYATANKKGKTPEAIDVTGFSNITGQVAYQKNRLRRKQLGM